MVLPSRPSALFGPGGWPVGCPRRQYEVRLVLPASGTVEGRVPPCTHGRSEGSPFRPRCRRPQLGKHGVMRSFGYPASLVAPVPHVAEAAPFLRHAPDPLADRGTELVRFRMGVCGVTRSFPPSPRSDTAAAPCRVLDAGPPRTLGWRGWSAVFRRLGSPGRTRSLGFAPQLSGGAASWRAPNGARSPRVIRGVRSDTILPASETVE